MGALIFFSFLAAVIIVPQVLKSQDRRRMYETMRAAYERGQPVPPEMVDAMTRRARMDPADVMEAVDPSYGINRDLRRGVILVAVGLGVLLIGVALYAGLYNTGGSVETLASCAAGGAVPFCIGLAYLGLWWFGRRKLKA